MAGEAYPGVPPYRYDWTEATEMAMREQLAPAAGRGAWFYRKEQGQWMLSSAELT